MAPRKERRLVASGGRLVAIGVPLLVLGIVLALVLNGTAVGIGAAIAVIGSIPIAVGIGLLLSAAVEQHARKGRPFA